MTAEPAVNQCDRHRPPLIAAVALAMVLIPLLVRSLTSASPFPGWQLDPFIIEQVETGLTPSWALAADAMALMGASWLLLLMPRRCWGGRGALLESVALAAGLALMLTHRATTEDDRLGAAWAAAWAGAVALRRAHAWPALARAAVAVLAGLAIMLAAKGAVQVFVEHPATVTTFRAQREQFLAAQGWTADSPMARGYERRLLQPEATGWWGLANVFASIAAALLGVWLGLCLAAWRSTSLAYRLALATGLMAAIACTALAGSKGGVIAAVLSAGVTLVLARLGRSEGPAGAEGSTRERRFARLLPAALIAGTLLAIAVRGALGERLSELSILFRAFYLEAAGRIIAAHPLVGVGPAGFRDAYLLAKNPLSPEDVASPHCLPADLIATLGLAGVGLTIVWLAWLSRAATAAVSRDHDGPAPAEAAERPDSTRDAQRADDAPSLDAGRLALLIIAGASVLALAVERAAISPETAALRVGGMVAWMALTLAVARVMERPGTSMRLVRAGLAGGSVALGVHSLIEVTPTWASSAALAMALMGLAARPAPARSHGRLRAAPLLAAAAALVASVAVTLAASRTFSWERSLALGSDAAQRWLIVQRRAEEATSVADPGQRRRAIEQLLRTEAAATGGTPWSSLEGFLYAERLEAILNAESALRTARADLPHDFQTWREHGRLLVMRAEAIAALGRPEDRAAAGRWVDEAAGDGPRDPALLGRLGLPIVPSVIERPSARAWRGLVQFRAAGWLGEPDRVERAVAHLDAAMARDPHNIQTARLLFDAVSASAREVTRSRAPAVARRVLELDDLARLDRSVRGLSAAERAAFERAAGVAAPVAPAGSPAGSGGP